LPIQFFVIKSVAKQELEEKEKNTEKDRQANEEEKVRKALAAKHADEAMENAGWHLNDKYLCFSN